MSAPSSSRPADVVILGGGVAGLEAMMALREHAGARVRIALVAAQQEFVERPMTVAEPFDRGTARRIPLERVAADFGATFIHAEAIGVNADATRVVFAGGESMGADTVIVAVGARPVAAFPTPSPSACRARAMQCARCWPISNGAPSGGSRSSRRASRAGRSRSTSSR
jgi:thioredoxin reductase